MTHPTPGASGTGDEYVALLTRLILVVVAPAMPPSGSRRGDQFVRKSAATGANVSQYWKMPPWPELG